MTVDVSEIRRIRLLGPTYGKDKAQRHLWNAELSTDINHDIGKDQGIARNASLRTLVETAEPKSYEIQSPVNMKVRLHDPKALRAAVRPHVGYGSALAIGTAAGDGSGPLARSFSLAAPADPIASQPLFSLITAVPATLSPADEAVAEWPNKVGQEIEVPPLALTGGAVAALIPREGKIAPSSVWAWLSANEKLATKPDKAETVHFSLFSRSEEAYFYASSTVQSLEMAMIENGEPVETKPDGSEGSERKVEHGAVADIPCVGVRLTREGMEFEGLMRNPFDTEDKTLTPVTVRLEVDQLTSAFRLRLLHADPPGMWRSHVEALLSALRASHAPLRANLQPGPLQLVWELTSNGALELQEFHAPKLAQGSLTASLVTNRLSGATIAPVAQLIEPRARIRTIKHGEFLLEVEAGAQPKKDDVRVALMATAVKGTFNGVFNISFGVAPFGNAQDKEGIVTSLKPAPLSADGVRLRQSLVDRYVARGVRKPDSDGPVDAFLALERGVLQLPVDLPVTKPLAPYAREKSFVGLAHAVSARAHIAVLVDDARHTAITAAFTKEGVSAVTAQFADAVGAIDGLLWTAERTPTAEEVVPTLAAGPISLSGLELSFGDPGAEAHGPLVTLASVIKDVVSDATLTIRATEGRNVIHWAPVAFEGMALASAINMTRTARNSASPSLTRDLMPTFHEVDKAKSLTIELKFAPDTPLPVVGSVSGGKSSQRGWQGLEPRDVPMVTVTLPGVEFSFPTAELSVSLDNSLRFDLPFLDEFHAAQAPSRERTGDSRENPEPSVTALDIEALKVAWRDAFRRLKLARTQSNRATHWKSGSVTGLIEPYTWEANFKVSGGNDPPIGKYELGRATFTGEAALADQARKFKLPDKGENIIVEKKDGTIEVTGFAVKPYDREVDGVEFQFDTRGVGLASDIVPGPNGIALRALVTTQADGQAGPVSSLLTTTLPLKLTNGTKLACLEVRDLPMTLGEWSKEDPRKAYVFDRKSTPENEPGPDPHVFNREKLPKSIYEWRLYEDRQAPARFDLSLGPLRLRPLRLLELAIGQENGSALRAVIAYSVKLAAQEREASSKYQPFAEDFNYETVNTIAVAYQANGGVLVPVAVTNISQANLEVDWTKAELPAAEINLHVEAHQTTALLGKETLTRAKIALSLEAMGSALLPKDKSGAVTVRLFGSEVQGGIGQVTVNDQEWKIETVIEKDTSEASRLAITALTCNLSNKPTIDIAGQIGLGSPKPDGKAIANFPLLINLDGTLSVLNWNSKAEWMLDTIDHVAGILAARVAHEACEKNLLRGLSIATSSLTGAVALAFEASPETGGSVDISAAYCEFDAPARESGHGALNYRVRHYHSQGSAKQQVEERLVVSLAETTRGSLIGWPEVDRVWLTSHFGNLYKAQPDEAHRPVLKPPRHKHTVTSKIAGLEIPAASLERGAITQDAAKADWLLAKPLRAKIFCAHALEYAGKATLAWTSIDDIAILDLSSLQKSLKGNEAFAFSPGYKGKDPRYASAGISRSGELDYVLTELIRNTVLSGKEPLAVFGSAAVEALTSQPGGRRLGLTFALPWIAAASEGTLTAFAGFSQMPADGKHFAVSAFDISASLVSEIGADAQVALPCGRGSIADVSAAIKMLFGERALVASRAVDRAFAENLFGQINFKTILQTPVFWQTIMALSSLVHTASDARAPRIAVTTLIPLGALRTVARIVPHLAEAEGSGLQIEGEAYDLCVVGRKQAEVIPVSLSGVGIGNVEDIDAETSRPLAILATERVAEPLTVILARIHLADRVLHCHDQFSAIVAAPAPLHRPQVRPLRQAAATVFQSPALGWPRASSATKETGNALSIGKGQPLQDSTVAWAGRARSFASQMRALDAAGERPFLAIGQHVLFDRMSAAPIAAPSDRALIPVPPRARVPAEGYGQSAEPLGASMLPGQYEVISTGVRPGVLVMEHAGIIVGRNGEEVDPEQLRFGAPADRAPIVWSQGRAPRSTSLPRTDDLARRRRTYLGENLRMPEAQGAQLVPFVVTRGPATSLRYTSAADKVIAVVVTVINPSEGRLGPAFDGTITLRFQSPSSDTTNPGEDLAARLRQEGLLKKMGCRCELIIGAASVSFRRAMFQTETDGSLTLTFSSLIDGGREKLAAALMIADADTDARLLIRQTALSKGDAVSKQAFDLAADADTKLVPGPPFVLALPLPLVPDGRPWLPIETATVMFGDPAYDRELAGPALSVERIDGDETTCLAIDRFVYDPGETIFFVFGKRNPDFDVPPREGKEAKEEPLPFKATDRGSLEIMLVREGAIGTAPVEVSLAVRGVDALTDLAGAVAYALPIKALVRANSLEPLVIKANDRIVLTLLQGDRAPLSVSIGIVSEPVIAPPSSAFAVVTLDRLVSSQATKEITRAATPVLIASAPLPQRVEFVDLLKDLARGHVRRRAVFEWIFPARRKIPNETYAGLVKIDRTGGGQICEKSEDFAAPFNT